MWTRVQACVFKCAIIVASNPERLQHRDSPATLDACWKMQIVNSCHIRRQAPRDLCGYPSLSADPSGSQVPLRRTVRSDLEPSGRQ